MWSKGLFYATMVKERSAHELTIAANLTSLW